MALRANLLRTFLAAALLTATGTGCPKKDTVKPTKPGPDPDTNSGPDAKRGGAKQIQPKQDPQYPNRLLYEETDSVSWPKLLRTKWKKVDLQVPGAQNILDCELHIDNTGADLNLDVFNGLGTQIGFSPGPAPNKLKKLAVQVEDVGVYFLRIQAAQPKDESDFSVQCAWEGRAPEPADPVKPPPKDPVVKNPVKPPRPPRERPVDKPAETLEEKLQKGVEGRIVQSHRERSVLVLYLDKGGAASVSVGTEGYVLAGKSGLEPVTKFKVVKVIDDNRSVGEADARSIGRNNRVVFLTK